jgi:predicted ribosome quality control (RQC) complex YloA/Tae2 family protein
VNLSHEELQQLVGGLKDELDEAQVRRVRQKDPFTVVFDFYLGETTRQLLVCTRPHEARLHYTFEAVTAGAESGHPTAFLMTARKWLTNARLTGMELDRRDRVVVLEFDRDEVRRKLVFECTGHHPNLFLTDGGLKILARLSDSHSHKRVLEVGKAYAFPVEPERKGLHDTGLMRFLATGERLHRDIESLFGAQEAARAWDERVRAVRAVLADRIRHEERKLDNIAGDLTQAEQATRYEAWGEALKANLQRIPRGAESYELRVGDHREDIPLNPALNALGNMEVFFRKARKFRDMLPFIAERKAKVHQAVEALKQEVGALEEARRARDAERVQALEARYLSREPEGAGPVREDQRAERGEDRRPFKEFRSAAGLSIRVGRSARDNVTLTFRLSNGRDLWFHARDHEGAHVVLHLDQAGEPDPASVQDAALLAAWHCRGNRQASLDVTCCEVKNLRPVKGAGPGAVLTSRERTIRVRLDPERLKHFLPEREFVTRPNRPPARPR